VADGLRHAAAALTVDLGDAPAGRMDVLPDTLAATLTSVRDAAGRAPRRSGPARRTPRRIRSSWPPAG
jgi:hypothetical protein